jgi:Icc-related predicted phosphoesterase
MPGYVLEFIATKLTVQPVYVFGNHSNGYLYDRDTGEKRLPGGCLNAHSCVLEVGGALIAGIEGSAWYRPGDHQYHEATYAAMAARMTPRLLWNKLYKGRAVDILLTHAPPKGPHEGEDYPHRGVAAFNYFAAVWKPKLHVHGHVHLHGQNLSREYITDAGVRVVNAYEFVLIEIDL